MKAIDMTLHDSRFDLDSEECGALIGALNEVTYGFVVPNFEQTIGLGTSAIEALINELQASSANDSVTLDREQAVAARNALRLTIQELGVDEFHTRTGYNFDRAKAIFKNIDTLLK